MSKIDLFSKPFVSRVFFFLLKRFFWRTCLFLCIIGFD
jgi:hypothetical protein